MLSTVSLVSDLSSVPREWVFEYYLGIPDKLQGQEVRIKSIWNPTENVPSMYVYYIKAESKYKFKDFSSGKGGDGVALVLEKFNLATRSEAARKIMRDYEEFISKNPAETTREYVEHFKYEVTGYSIREWTTSDEAFWTQYRIGSDMLGRYCVRPLENFTMQKKELGGGVKEIVIARSRLYGFFRLDGTLYKIYQPGNPDHKFIKVQSFIQGSEQLAYSTQVLIITKALKDIMCVNRMGLPVELAAPDSENTMIPPYIIQVWKSRYPYICTLFDNDSAGIKAMKRYEKEYGIPYVHLKAEKDISDTTKVHGLDNSTLWLRKGLEETLNIKL